MPLHPPIIGACLTYNVLHMKFKLLSSILIRALLYGCVFYLGLVVTGSILATLAVMAGYREPIGLLRDMVDVVIFLGGAPTFWISPPYDLLKNVIHISAAVLFWGLSIELFIRYVLKKKQNEAVVVPDEFGT